MLTKLPTEVLFSMNTLQKSKLALSVERSNLHSLILLCFRQQSVLHSLEFQYFSHKRSHLVFPDTSIRNSSIRKFFFEY